MDTSVGPFRIEVVEGLKQVRYILEDRSEQSIAMDISWTGAIPAFEEPRQYIRRHGRVLFDSMRFAQTGYWSGSLRVGDKEYDVVPDTWKGSRDRSWGIRPVGEHEPPGIQASVPIMEGMWNIDRSVIRFPEAPGSAIEVKVTPLTHVWVMVGTGYGLEPDWKHGMYKSD